MWPYFKELLHRGYIEALSKGSSTSISVFWLGFFVLILGYFCTVVLEWFSKGRNLSALKTALKSWHSVVGSVLALFLGWLILLFYSMAYVGYEDHAELIDLRAKREALPLITILADMPKTSKPRQGGKSANTRTTQTGNGNVAKPVTISGDVKQGGNGDCQANAINGDATVAEGCGKPDPNKGTQYFDPFGHSFLTHGGTIDMLDGEFPKYTEIREASQQRDWALVKNLSEAEIKSVPSWPTPYLFSAIANINLCNPDFAVERLDHFLKEAEGNIDYATPESGDFTGQAKNAKIFLNSSQYSIHCKGIVIPRVQQ